MRTATLKTRGQSALFAGLVLAVVTPLFRLGVLVPTGYANAVANAAAARNYAPLLEWSAGHSALVAITAALDVLPFAAIIVLPYTLRRVVFGEAGRVAQWIGIAGLALFIVMGIIDLVLLVSATNQFAGADSALQGAVGGSYRLNAIGAGLVNNVLGSLLMTIWLVMVNIPLARLGGFERWVGFAGVTGAAIYGAAALLALFDPQQALGAVIGSAIGWFGFWLILVGILLLQRAPYLGEDAETALGESDADTMGGESGDQGASS